MTSTDYLLPRLLCGGAEYTIVRWLKRVGDAVSVGEPLLVVVNDRVEAALPALCAGILVWLAEGKAVAAGARVATIVASTVADGSDLPDSPRPNARISPVARRIIHSENIDITELKGSGISGWITKADALAAHTGRAQLEARPFPHPPSSNVYALTLIDVDLERVALVIAQQEPSFARRRLELSYRVCVALAVVAALPSHSLLNSYWADTRIVIRRRVHLAVVARDGTPIRYVSDAQDLNLRGLARGLGGPAVEHGSKDSTFTIAELGDHFWGDPAAWARGGAAALGIGALRQRPLVLNDNGVDRLAVRHVALLTLAYDARVLDQHHADAFLRDLKSRLEQFHV
ncbi:MAG: 2-oxo acid dehydrogenase subunit E2 [Roseiflexaceae bacterium]